MAKNESHLRREPLQVLPPGPDRHRDVLPVTSSAGGPACAASPTPARASARPTTATATARRSGRCATSASRCSQGEVLGIIGRNGAGKSTLLKILSRITAPTSGQVKVQGPHRQPAGGGHRLPPRADRAREHLPQRRHPGHDPRTRCARKFDEIVDFAEVEKFIDTPVKRYSSGMYVRLAFAVAAHLEPEILLVDEVLAVGDAEFQKKCLGKMGEVAKEGRTVLFVSHNMAAVQVLCGLALLLTHGQVTAYGTTQHILSIYLNATRDLQAISLHSRKDRSGDGRLRFKEIYFKRSDSITTDTLVTGQDAVISLDYEALCDIQSAKISIGFSNNLGQFLSLCDNEIAGYPLNIPKGFGQIQCHLPRLSFTPGQYQINLFCSGAGDVIDWLREAYSFIVEEGDFFGSGRIPPPTHGGMLIEQSWRINIPEIEYDAKSTTYTSK